jgi:hypothetical protein
MDARSTHITIEPKSEAAALVAEWQERPLGRLGRRLLPEIETYLEFFAIARSN